MAFSDTSLTYIKSTMDKIGVDLAQVILSPTAVALDLDDSEDVRRKLGDQKNSAVVWRILDFSNSRVPTLNSLAVGFAASVADDSSNMSTMSLAGTIYDRFCVGKQIEIRDYTGSVEGGLKGHWGITSIDTNPQVDDGNRGYRFIVIEGMYFDEITP